MENNHIPVDGVGFWNMLTRTFQSPEMACLDLIDNVFDAAPLSNGRLNMNVEEHDGLELENTNGIYILNNCQNPVQPMREVLTYFNNIERDRIELSKKGIGLKQACATLSDISFVMSRNEHVYSLGIIARNLQTPAGLCLPSYTFQMDPAIEMDLYQFLMEEEVADIVGSSDTISAVIQEYGHGDVTKGIFRLVKNMMRMNDEEEI